MSPFAAGQQGGASDTKRAWDAARQAASQPMGPGQSMAMAGNTGLAGFSENQANEIKQAQQAIQNYNQSQGGGSNEPPVSFKQIGQQIGELGSKYRSPVGFDQYANKAMLFNQGIAGGGKIVVGPDGIPRLQFGDQVVRDPNTGQQMLSMMLPQLTASAPTLSQLGGDISRAFTGYDSLKYPNQNFQGPFPVGQNRNMPYMQSTPGMFSNINPLSIIPGVGMVMKIGEGIKGVYDFMFPKPPVVNYGGSSNITVTEEPTFVSPTFDDQKIEIQQLPALLPPSQQADATFLNDQTNFEKALANARVENTGLGLDSLKAAYEFARNPNLNTQYGNFSLNDLLTGEPTLGYETDLFGGKIGLSANPLQDQYGVNYSLTFNKGGSVNKHSGLGYMLK